MRLLLIEDHDLDSYFLQVALRDSPGQYEVTRARTLQEGCELLSKEPFELVLLDLLLPDSRDLSALAKLREARLCPVIIITTISDIELGFEAMHHGAQDYLVKPAINSDMLHRAIQCALLRHRRLLSPVRREELVMREKELLLELTDSQVKVQSALGHLDRASDSLEQLLAGCRPPYRGADLAE